VRVWWGAGRGEGEAADALPSSDEEADDALPRRLPDPGGAADPSAAADGDANGDAIGDEQGGVGPGVPGSEPGYERRDAGGAPVPLAPELATLSLLPRSQWQSLVHLEAIKARGPLAPPPSALRGPASH